MRSGRIVVGYGLVHEIADVIAVLLQLIEGRLDRLIDGLLDVPAHVLDLVHALDPSLVVMVGNKDGRHVEARPIERGSFAQFLHDLHHDSLSVTLVSGLIGLGKVKPHSLRVLLAQRLHDVQRALAKGLTDRIEEDEDEIDEIAQP